MDIQKVYIIDDEEPICLLLSSLLRKEGIDTEYSTLLSGSVSKVKSFDPDVVFLDLSLKDGSGFSIIPQLKKEVPEAQIVVISAHSSDVERKQADTLGVKTFLPKPLNRDLILQSLEQIQ